MGQQPVDSILGNRQLGIVIIVGMDRSPVGQGCEAGGKTQITPQHGDTLIAAARERFQVLSNEAACWRDRATKGQTQSVQNETLSQARTSGGMAAVRVVATNEAT